MNLEAWDEELRSIALFLKEQRDDLEQSSPSPCEDLIKHRASVLQQQCHLQRTLDRLHKLSNRKGTPNARSKTLMYWAGVYRQKIAEHYEQQVSVIGKAMWLKLIGTRLAGNRSSRMMTDEADLLDMAMRQANLVKTERFLQRKLVELRARKASLHERYRTGSIAQENRAAAKSMDGCFGSSWSDAQRHDVLKRLSTALLCLTWPTRLSDEDRWELTNLQEDIHQQTQGLLGRCRNLIIDAMGGEYHYISAKTRERLRQSLLHIEDLRQALQFRTSMLSAKLPSPARPKVMKKSSNHGRTTNLAPRGPQSNTAQGSDTERDL